MSESDWSKLTVALLKEELKRRNVMFDSKARKDDLVAKLIELDQLSATATHRVQSAAAVPTATATSVPPTSVVPAASTNTAVTPSQPTPTSAAASAAASTSVDVPKLSEIERRKLREQRFGMVSNAASTATSAQKGGMIAAAKAKATATPVDPVIAARMARFGMTPLPASSTTKSKHTPASGSKSAVKPASVEVDPEILKKREARFGAAPS